ncbi:hypothetical protein Skr01_53350 [Sphaerisporangium krabiense]|uniref:Uncharacterized protein n=1 Tax=Sphaerisporangium krabiense TaxID=763782 RepID=A0A7W8Z456_9ACTN|nr:hypothetical protein [Sphaerisporangium krabiense]MBB5627094.1 hypothetical protein [Sphaerisporangium krabiense]GII65250.1 hypothetical protein Skr01_53350 [Sphaerisporangium krabiense]
MAAHDGSPANGRPRREETPEALREELRVVDEDLAGLRQTVRELRERIGDRADGPTDMTEIGALINMADEQDGFIATLEARRENLLGRLREASGEDTP